MINKHLFILLVNLFVLAYPQTINIEGKKLNIGMDKSIALDIMLSLIHI